MDIDWNEPWHDGRCDISYDVYHQCTEPAVEKIAWKAPQEEAVSVHVLEYCVKHGSAFEHDMAPYVMVAVRATGGASRWIRLMSLQRI